MRLFKVSAVEPRCNRMPYLKVLSAASSTGTGEDAPLLGSSEGELELAMVDSALLERRLNLVNQKPLHSLKRSRKQTSKSFIENDLASRLRSMLIDRAERLVCGRNLPEDRGGLNIKATSGAVVEANLLLSRGKRKIFKSDWDG
jgi:hypothetical protein